MRTATRVQIAIGVVILAAVIVGLITRSYLVVGIAALVCFVWNWAGRNARTRRTPRP